MNSNDGKDLSNIVQKLEVLRRYGYESLLSLNSMDYNASELHFIHFMKELKTLNASVEDFYRLLEDRKHES